MAIGAVPRGAGVCRSAHARRSGGFGRSNLADVWARHFLNAAPRRRESWILPEGQLQVEMRGNKPTTAKVDTRAFVRLRRAAIVSAPVMALVEDLSKRVDVHDAVITDIVESIRQIVEGPGRGGSRPIGFTANLERED